MMKEISKADLLIKQGEHKKAHILLEKLLANDLEKYAEDAIGIYLYGCMYKEAEEIFYRYKDKTKRELVSDWTIEEIKEMNKSENQNIKNEQIFLLKKWHKHHTLFGSCVTKIKLNDTGIELYVGSKKRTYTLDALRNAHILNKEPPSHYMGLILFLVIDDGTKAKTYNLSYLSDELTLLSSLKKRYKIKVEYKKLPQLHKDPVFLLLAFGLAIYYLLKYLDVIPRYKP